MKYLLMFCGSAQDLEAWQALPEEARAEQNAKVGQWFGKHSAKIKSSNRLLPPHTSTSVHFGANDEPLITDGPFLEGTEVIGGYAEIEVEDLDEALEIAKEWPARPPARSVIEVRPLV
ncbi:MAG TPA: YciI family protein [Herpetosiphonaceae bacterium]